MCDSHVAKATTISFDWTASNCLYCKQSKLESQMP